MSPQLRAPAGLRPLLGTLLVCGLAVAIGSAHAAETGCKPTTRSWSIEQGTVTLDVEYQIAELIVGRDFMMDVQIADSAVQERPIQSVHVEFTRGGMATPPITLLNRVGPLQSTEGGRRLTRSRLIYTISKDAPPGPYYAKVQFELGGGRSLEDLFCLPVGSTSDEYLSVELDPKDALTLPWWAQQEVVAQLSNTSPFPYLVTEISTDDHRGAPYALDVSHPRLPLEVARQASGFKATVKARAAWSSLFSFSNRLSVGEAPVVELRYVDAQERPVAVKRVVIPFAVIPPAWLLWVLAVVGGLVGSALHSALASGGKFPPGLTLAVGAAAAFVVYGLFNLGQVSVLITNLRLTLDNNNGVVAALLGLLGGWLGEKVLNRVTGA